jgi:hypothetical protein
MIEMENFVNLIPSVRGVMMQKEQQVRPMGNFVQSGATLSMIDHRSHQTFDCAKRFQPAHLQATKLAPISSTTDSLVATKFRLSDRAPKLY